MLLYFPIIASLIAVLFAVFLMGQVKQTATGSEEVKKVASAIRDGATTFLKSEFKVLLPILIIITILLGIFASWGRGLSFLLGAFLSGLAGFLGMWVSTQANLGTANSALDSFPKAFKTAFRSGTVMGMLVTGFGLMGLTLVWIFTKDPQFLITFAFGGSLIALFMRVGGGMYTKAADVGADLVGKVEEGIPEDDPRNPGVIADAVGDNVGDVAGMGSDLFESYVSAIAATAVLGVPLYGVKGLLFPTCLAAAGIIASIIGSLLVRVEEKDKFDFQESTQRVRSAMTRGIVISNLLMIAAAYFITRYFFTDLNIFYALLTGLVVGFLISKLIEYYTSDRYSPVLAIAKASQTGASTNIIEGLAQGMVSVVGPAVLVGIAMIVVHNLAGLFGIALSSLGILAVLGINLSADSYGPVVDNAAGIAEMGDMPSEVREKADALDSVGNTTAATGKGFAIGSAGLVALAWLANYFEAAQLQQVDLMNPVVISGLFIGAMLPFLFCSFTMRAVSKGAFAVIEEVRRQFEQLKGIMEGETEPDYDKCVDITTKRALKSMILPGLAAVAIPALVGFTLGWKSLAGVLLGTLVTGFLLAVMMANSGGAWDNAKKYIEADNFGGKGSDAHKASVVGDTVGDPFKDTSGPSLNILIKLVGIIALILVSLTL
ncbi:MAG: sodium-translocating pyrophosphatase [Candidatus Paceibacterota bacterium]